MPFAIACIRFEPKLKKALIAVLNQPVILFQRLANGPEIYVAQALAKIPEMRVHIEVTSATIVFQMPVSQATIWFHIETIQFQIVVSAVWIVLTMVFQAAMAKFEIVFQVLVSQATIVFQMVTIQFQ